MNDQTLHELQQVHEYPALSILLPTYYKSSEDLQQNPVRLRKLIREAIDRLLSEFTRPQIKALLQHLDEVAETVDFNHPLKGLAIFASASMGKSIQLPFSVDEQVVIDENFATRHLVHARNRSKRYYLLLITRDICRLYDCQRDSLHEISENGFPLSNTHANDQTEGTGYFGQYKNGNYNTQQGRETIHLIDESLDKIISNNEVPLVVAGVERNLAFFNHTSKHQNRQIATVEGSYEKVALPELAKTAWKAAREGFDRKRRDMLGQLDNAVGAKQFASGIDGVWRVAQEGRVATLLVEEGFRYPATVSEDGLSLHNHSTGISKDAVDEVIETVLQRNGQVIFQENGALNGHQQIAAITRF